MDDDIGLGLSSMAVCFDFGSTNVVHLSNRNPYFYPFWCHHPIITQLTAINMFWVVTMIWFSYTDKYTTKFWNLGFWTLGMAFNFFWHFIIFLRSLVSKKSSGMQKSYIWSVFHAKQFSLPIFSSSSLCVVPAFQSTAKTWFRYQ